ncbi:hypothetical protein BC936DRAFT_140387 [Jimgerdemannia flammicorona]|uniref:Uncharacterized protein n=1 Tax=Jimgerdemannia flammicorona TaxID=994334 RepID=A0A433DGU1_9FUNG|nr:hypothetical protein BC936DRAFT_140387 [Jimgerdemannia flammicorona]
MVSLDMDETPPPHFDILWRLFELEPIWNLFLEACEKKLAPEPLWQSANSGSKHVLIFQFLSILIHKFAANLDGKPPLDTRPSLAYFPSRAFSSHQTSFPSPPQWKDLENLLLASTSGLLSKHLALARSANDFILSTVAKWHSEDAKEDLFTNFDLLRIGLRDSDCSVTLMDSQLNPQYRILYFLRFIVNTVIRPIEVALGPSIQEGLGDCQSLDELSNLYSSQSSLGGEQHLSQALLSNGNISGTKSVLEITRDGDTFRYPFCLNEAVGPKAKASSCPQPSTPTLSSRIEPNKRRASDPVPTRVPFLDDEGAKRSSLDNLGKTADKKKRRKTSTSRSNLTKSLDGGGAITLKKRKFTSGDLGAENCADGKESDVAKEQHEIGTAMNDRSVTSVVEQRIGHPVGGVREQTHSSAGSSGTSAPFEGAKLSEEMSALVRATAIEMMEQWKREASQTILETIMMQLDTIVREKVQLVVDDVINQTMEKRVRAISEEKMAEKRELDDNIAEEAMSSLWQSRLEMARHDSEMRCAVNRTISEIFEEQLDRSENWMLASVDRKVEQVFGRRHRRLVSSVTEDLDRVVTQVVERRVGEVKGRLDGTINTALEAILKDRRKRTVEDESDEKHGVRWIEEPSGVPTPIPSQSCERTGQKTTMSLPPEGYFGTHSSPAWSVEALPSCSPFTQVKNNTLSHSSASSWASWASWEANMAPIINGFAIYLEKQKEKRLSNNTIGDDKDKNEEG